MASAAPACDSEFRRRIPTTPPPPRGSSQKLPMAERRRLTAGLVAFIHQIPNRRLRDAKPFPGLGNPDADSSATKSRCARSPNPVAKYFPWRPTMPSRRPAGSPNLQPETDGLRNWVAWVAAKISLLTELSDGARLCPQNQSQRVDGRRRLKIFCGAGLLVAVRKHLRPGLAIAVLQPQSGCSIQPSVGRRSRATLGERAK